MKLILRKKIRAFSLVEVLIYIGIFGAFIIGIVEFAIATTDFNRNAESYVGIERSLVFVNSHINETFRKVKSIDDGNSTFNNVLGVLALTDSGITWRYQISQNRLMVTTEGQNFFITPADVQVTRFLVERVNNTKTGNIEGVRVTIDVRSTKNTLLTRSTTTSYTLIW